MKYTDPAADNLSTEITVKPETGGSMAVYVNQYSGEVLEVRPDRSTFAWTVRYLHSLRFFGATPRMVIEIVAGWIVDDPAQVGRASAALALRAQLAERPGRIGVCADRQCADVWVDQSPAGRRRFCCLTCQNRARAETFRARQRR